MEEAIRRARRPLFRPRAGQEYVFVKHVRVGPGVYAAPGEKAEGKVFVLRVWYQRGLIGVKGTDWTEAQLKRAAMREERDLMRALEEEEAAKPVPAILQPPAVELDLTKESTDAEG